MREDRDHFIIFLTLLPAMLFIALYVMWRAAGEPAVMAPDLPFPALSLPILPDLRPFLPQWALTWWGAIVQNGDSVLPAIGFGAFMGLVGFGTLIDLFKTIWKRIRGSLRRPPAPTLEETIDSEIA